MEYENKCEWGHPDGSKCLGKIKKRELNFNKNKYNIVLCEGCYESLLKTSINNLDITEKFLKKFKINQKEEKPIIKNTSFLEFDKYLVEQIYQEGKNKFAIYNTETDQVEYKDEIIVNEITYKPLEGKEIKKGVIMLPSYVQEYENDKKLDDEIWDFTYKWSDVDEKFRKYAVLHIKRSWVYDKFYAISYLRGLGDFGTGKTRFKITFGCLHYKPILSSGAATSAALKRIIEKWKGTLLIDEADLRNSDETNDTVKIINLGFEKGQCIFNCHPDDKSEIEFFDPYCPKVIVMRKKFNDPATESRCMTHILKMTTRKDIPVELTDDFFKESQILRNKLLLWRFRNYHKIDQKFTKDIDLGDIEPRLKQANIGFAALFCHDSKQLEEFKKYLLGSQEEITEERRNSWEGMIIETIFQLEKEGNKDISCQDITEKGNLKDKEGKPMNPRYISSILKTLGLKVEKPKKVDGKPKRCIILNREYLNQLYKRYGVTEVTEDTDSKESDKEDSEEADNNRNNRDHRNFDGETEQPKITEEKVTDE
ncbi:MAG: hypothetical protein PHD81_03415 [Candidatus Nanoarchaeia archaeon]|nr:hypothetical protein [Candidatus Nanoarchaeia archaeon]MDD5588133.1 hypothetical protein [Candidatus Nanoarchaeia archaeon]